MGLNLDAMKAESAKNSFEGEKDESKARKDGRFEAKVGENIIRVLPPTYGRDVLHVGFFRHFRVGPDGLFSPICPKSISKKHACPVCDVYWSKIKSGDENIKAEAKIIRAKPRYKILVVDMKAPQDGILVFEIGKVIFDDIVAKIGMYGDISDLKTGRNFNLIRTGTGRDTKYSLNPYDPSEIGVDMSQAPDIIDTLNIPSFEELQGMLNGSFNIGRDADGPLAALKNTYKASEPVAQPIAQAPPVTEAAPTITQIAQPTTQAAPVVTQVAAPAAAPVVQVAAPTVTTVGATTVNVGGDLAAPVHTESVQATQDDILAQLEMGFDS